MTAHSSSPNALVVYASTHGHTAKIAAHLAEAMRRQSLAVDDLDVSEAAGTDPERYDVVVVAASLHKVHHQAAIVAWVSEHRRALEQRPSVFLSVSLSAADDTDDARMAVQSAIDDFRDETGWTPGRCEPIAGSLQYREYDVFTRQLMRLLMKRMGRPTDASHDYDYTDWDALDRLGVEIAGLTASATVG